MREPVQTRLRQSGSFSELLLIQASRKPPLPDAVAQFFPIEIRGMPHITMAVSFAITFPVSLAICLV
jgi:hypothetical protein